ncbi:GDP-mannose 4,6-dehydratase [Methylobacterium sp. HMF5984]|uniref:GDP-mannose 4,6-dehydratase n=1 Tax=Methylobacterium sp. HMF5984 TaxID=3367370 RepID=UPI003852277D
MKRILVTGAAGFVGRHALAALSAGTGAADRILGIGRGRPAVLPERVAYETVDLLDEAALHASVAAFRPTDVLHLAAMASVQQSADAPGETWRVNLVGLLNLAEAVARSAPGAGFLFVSSGEVYGRAFLAGRPLTEAAVPDPQGPYARSKWFGEAILRDLLAKAKVRLVILRPFNQIGAGQDERFVVPSFAGQIARIEAGLVAPVLAVGNLAAERDFLPVGDVVRAYVDLIGRGLDIADGSVFNVASGRPRSIASVVDDLRRHARVPFEVRVAADRMRPSEIPVAAGDATRLTEATGWTPKADWDAALADVLEHARATLGRSAR